MGKEEGKVEAERREERLRLRKKRLREEKKGSIFFKLFGTGIGIAKR